MIFNVPINVPLSFPTDELPLQSKNSFYTWSGVLIFVLLKERILNLSFWSVYPAPLTADLSFTPSCFSWGSCFRNAIFSLQICSVFSLPAAPPALALTFCPCVQSLSSFILWDNPLLPIPVRNKELPGLCCVLIISLVLSLYSHYLPLALPLMSSDATQKQNYHFFIIIILRTTRKKLLEHLDPNLGAKLLFLGDAFGYF